MTDAYYPQIDTDALELMIHLQKSDPEYIFGGGFSVQIEELFTALTRKPEMIAVPEGNAWDHLVQQIGDLHTELKTAGENLDAKDNAEKMAYFRVATSLLEKLVGLHERGLNLRRIGQFQQLVVQIMEDELDGDQRAKVRQRLIDFNSEN